MEAIILKTVIVIILILGSAYYYYRSKKKAQFVNFLWTNGKFIDLEHPDAPFKYTVIKHDGKLYDTEGNRLYALAKAEMTSKDGTVTTFKTNEI